MIKTILISSLVSASLASTAFMAAGRVHYSGLQLQTPFGSAYKMTPDPSNIWSFHETYTITKGGKHSIPVLVDFDKNGKMDTEHKDVRVLITDISIRRGLRVDAETNGLQHLSIADDKGDRWSPAFAGYSAQNVVFPLYVDHLVTPIALPVDSGLKVEFTASPSGSSGQNVVHIHIIGRLVTL